MESPGTVLVIVSEIMDYFTTENYVPLNGIMADMPTYIRSSEEDKRLLADLVDLFPSLRLKCHEPTGEIRTLPFGRNFPGAESLTSFIAQICSNFTSRKIRTCERSGVHLPALISTSPEISTHRSCKAVTANISIGGCFLIHFETMNVNEHYWLEINSLQDSTPIPIEVCWVRAWGDKHSLPGTGIRFLEVTGSQKAELMRLGGRLLMTAEN